MSAATYLVMAHCEADDHPISVHYDLESAKKAAGEVTPDLTGKCAGFSVSRTGPSGPIQPLETSVYEFRSGRLAGAYPVKNFAKVVGRRSPDSGALRVATENNPPFSP